MHPLQLTAKPGAFRVFATRRSDPAFKVFSDRVHKRDNYTCQFCGFQARDFQEVVNLDQNYYNNKMSNLTTACCFCTQCFFLDCVGTTDMGGGTLIYLPEMDQANLNSFSHVLFCAIANNTSYKTLAQSIYRTLKYRSQIIEQQFGEGVSEPAVMAQLLVEAMIDKKKSELMLQDIRLLPSRSHFKKQIDHWAKTALQEIAKGED